MLINIPTKILRDPNVALVAVRRPEPGSVESRVVGRSSMVVHCFFFFFGHLESEVEYAKRLATLAPAHRAVSKILKKHSKNQIEKRSVEF